MAAQKQDDQLERTFSSYVRIQVVVLKTYQGRWTIGRSGERGSGISVLPARYDDDDDDDFYTLEINKCLNVLYARNILVPLIKISDVFPTLITVYKCGKYIFIFYSRGRTFEHFIHKKSFWKFCACENNIL